MRIAVFAFVCLALTPPLAGLQAPAPARPRLPVRREIPWLDFSPHGVWRGHAQRVRANRAQMLAQRRFSALNARPLSPGIASTTTVSGTIVEPVVLFKFTDTPGGEILGDTTAYDSVLYARVPPNGRPYTVRTYYEQLTTIGLAPPLITITGKSFGFVTLAGAEGAYTGGTSSTCQQQNPFGVANCNGIFSDSAFTVFQGGLRESLDSVNNKVDWTQFTTHGDTLDLVVFVHPNKDGACGGFPSGGAGNNNHIWSHRSFLTPSYITHDGREIVDYIIESGVGGASACDTTQIMPVGTVAHETGHGFDLPDLYDTSPTETGEGDGEYSLMSSGNYSSPLSPSRMDPWSLMQLGWVNVVPLTIAGTYQFGGVPASDTVFYVRAQGTNPRGEYFLLENRQSIQSDSAMIHEHCLYSQQHGSGSGCTLGQGGGLLVWHVDSVQMANHGFMTTNDVNTGLIHGLEVEQADGHADLDRGLNRGDAGDPFPGVANALAFMAARNYDRAYAGFTIDQLQQLSLTGSRAMSFRLQFVPYMLSTTAVVSQLLAGTGLTTGDVNYLDNAGNRTGQFDVGDFLAWVKATGATPPAAGRVVP